VDGTQKGQGEKRNRGPGKKRVRNRLFRIKNYFNREGGDLKRLDKGREYPRLQGTRCLEVHERPERDKIHEQNFPWNGFKKRGGRKRLAKGTSRRVRTKCLAKENPCFPKQVKDGVSTVVIKGMERREKKENPGVFRL